MPTITPDQLDSHGDKAAPQNEPFLITVPDAERLVLQSRFVRNQIEGQILSEIGARIRSATLLDPYAVPGDLVTMNSRVVLREAATGRQHVLTVSGRLWQLRPLLAQTALS